MIDRNRDGDGRWRSINGVSLIKGMLSLLLPMCNPSISAGDRLLNSLQGHVSHRTGRWHRVRTALVDTEYLLADNTPDLLSQLTCSGTWPLKTTSLFLQRPMRRHI